MNENEVFTVEARRCKRCGRLLVSKKEVEAGYGESCACKMRKEKEAREPIPGQLHFTFDGFTESEIKE